MESELPKNIIEVERIFDTDVATLFNAWTQLDHLSQWWRPMGETLNDMKNELQEGGTIAYYIGQAGLEVTGLYKEVIPNEKLVYSWIWNMSDEGSADGYTLHIQFSPHGQSQSRLQVRQEGFSAPEYLPAHQEGWDKGLNDLAAYFSSMNKEKN